MEHQNITEYQNKFAEFLGRKYAFAFWKGRVALYSILRALGIGSGDEIIVPGYTCVMNVNPIKYLGAKPVYVDIEPDTFNLDTALLEQSITPNTKLIIAQHTYGYPCRMEKILDIAGKKNLIVIEDCCLALGSRYKGKVLGTMGKAAYFSSQWNKPFTTGLGGMAVTDDPQLARKIEQLRLDNLCRPGPKELFMLAAQLAVYRLFIYPRTTALAQMIFRYLTKKGAVVGSSSSAEFTPVMADDFFKSISPLQARAGTSQLGRVQKNINHRREMTALYDQLLGQKGWKIISFDPSIIDPVMVRYPVRIKEKRQALEQAAGAGVELGSWFECPLHPRETPLAVYDYKMGTCPVAEAASAQVVNLPVHLRASRATVQRTVEFITRFTQVQ